MVGQKQAGRVSSDLGHNIGVSEAMQVERGDTGSCSPSSSANARTSIAAAAGLLPEVELQVHEMAMEMTHEGDQTTNALRALFMAARD